MARPAPTHPDDLPAVEEIEAAAGPRETTVYDDHGVLTTIPTRYWAAYDRRGDPRRQLLRAAYEGLEREGQIEDADAWLSAE
jgi:hypothetical protein